MFTKDILALPTPPQRTASDRLILACAIRGIDCTHDKRNGWTLRTPDGGHTDTFSDRAVALDAVRNDPMFCKLPLLSPVRPLRS